VLLRLAYLTVANTFAALRLLPMSDRDKDAEILALRHQIMVLERQLGKEKVRFAPEDRAFLATLRLALRRLRHQRNGNLRREPQQVQAGLFAYTGRKETRAASAGPTRP
jgi:hypothetical protein